MSGCKKVQADIGNNKVDQGHTESGRWSGDEEWLAQQNPLFEKKNSQIRRQTVVQGRRAQVEVNVVVSNGFDDDLTAEQTKT